MHEAKQPSVPFLAHSALALATQVWSVVHDLCDQYPDLMVVLREIDALVERNPPGRRTGHDLSTTERRKLEKLYAQVPRGPARRLYWVNQALTEGPPNDYYEKFVVFGEMLCPQCKRWLGREHVHSSTPHSETAECPWCHISVKATLPFNEHR